MEEVTKKNRKRRLVERYGKVLKRFDASLEWLMERICPREEEKEKTRHDDEIDESEKNQKLKAMKMRSIDDVLEEVDVLIDTHFFGEFCRTKSSSFLNRVIQNQGSIEIKLFRRTWKSLNCTPKH